MTLKNTNPWKLLSIGLLGIIAIGLITPIDAKPSPDNDSISIIQALLENATFGLVALDTDIGNVQSSVNDVDSDVAAVQASVDAILDKLRCEGLVGADLSGQDLSGSNFSGCDLSGADLGGSDLSGADLTGATLTGALMRDVDLTGTTLGTFYIDTTFACAHDEVGQLLGCQNNCDSGDTAISLLEMDESIVGGFLDGESYIIDGISTETTVLTTLCEDTTP